MICSTSNKAYIFLGFLQTGSYILQFQMFSSNANRKINSFLCYLQLVRNWFDDITLLGTFPLECMVYSFVLSRGTSSQLCTHEASFPRKTHFPVKITYFFSEMEKLMKHTFCQQILSFTTVTFVMKTSNENKRRNFVTQVQDSF